MNSEHLKCMEPLTWMKGKWKGSGKGSFPTMDPFEYDSQMNFRFLEDAFQSEPLIQFEEVAWILEGGQRQFKHWETGFFKPVSADRIQFYVTHNTGRIEVTYGVFSQLNLQSKSFILHLESEFLRNDAGLKVAHKSFRSLTLEGDSFRYLLEMSTEQVPDRTHHLESTLSRVV